jgi:ring-1,2-phenylacetyl-CoA epoxidase subunit PaaE
MLRFFPLKIADIRRETSASVSINFEVPARWKRMYQFKQGQYLTLRATINRREVRRTYSICSGLHENELRIAVKRTANGRFSNYALDNLRAGQLLEVMPPHGHFFTELDPAENRRYLLCAVGSGITPVISILKSVLALEPLSHAALFYGNRSIQDIMFREELQQLEERYGERISVAHYLTRENTEVMHTRGRLDSRIVPTARTHLGAPNTWHACFLCGPREMTLRLSQDLAQEGVAPDRIHVELFQGSGGPVPDGVVTDAAVTVIFEGQRTELSLGRGTVLDAALDLDIDLPYACRMGSCGTCLGRVVAGRAHMAVNNNLGQTQIDAGYVLTCQTRALSPTLIVSCDLDEIES